MEQNKIYDVHAIGIVVWGTKNIYKILPYRVRIDDYNAFIDSDIIECRIKGKRGDSNDERTFLLAGDIVKYTLISEGQGLITERIKRENSILRKRQDNLQAIAVNLDLLLIVSTINNPPFRPRFIDRLIYIAKCESIEILLVINKIDLSSSKEQVSTILNSPSNANLENNFEKKPIPDNLESYIDEEIKDRLQVYTQIGVEIIYTSAIYNLGLEKLREKLSNKRCAVVGQSGVGKSSIINMLIADANRQTGEISEKYNRGKHTTIRPEVIWGSDFYLVDTPGIRELYPEHADITTLIDGYPDIFQYAQECKLPNCSHREEPGCAVQTKIGNEIHQDRYESYIRLRESMEEMENNKWYRQKR